MDQPHCRCDSRGTGVGKLEQRSAPCGAISPLKNPSSPRANEVGLLGLLPTSPHCPKDLSVDRAVRPLCVLRLANTLLSQGPSRRSTYPSVRLSGGLNQVSIRHEISMLFGQAPQFFKKLSPADFGAVCRKNHISRAFVPPDKNLSYVKAKCLRNANGLTPTIDKHFRFLLHTCSV